MKTDYQLKPYSINSSGADMTLELLANKLDNGDIEIPEFQRSHVWNIQKASKLIESFLLGLPVPQIFLYLEPETRKLLVVDGQQRLRGIHAFIKGVYKGREFRLSGLSSEWDGMTYEELSDADRRRFRNATLRSTIFEQVDPQDNTSIFEVFERLNTGGMRLTAQEVRNAVIGGDLNQLIKELREHPTWIALSGARNPDDRFKSTELILRLIALSDDFDTYKKPMNIFLSNYLEKHKHLTPEEKDSKRKQFIETIEAIKNEIGPNALRLNKSLSASLSDAVYVGVARNINNLSPELKQKWNTLIHNEVFLDAVSRHTTDLDKITARISLAIDLFKNVK
jgi:uncharacterized protein with ParB-like and HNH nuclease domain